MSESISSSLLPIPAVVLLHSIGKLFIILIILVGIHNLFSCIWIVGEFINHSKQRVFFRGFSIIEKGLCGSCNDTLLTSCGKKV